MKLLENVYQSTEFSIKKSTLTQTWKRGTINMTNKEFREVMNQLVDETQQYHPRYLLMNFKRSSFTISVGLQAWIIEKIIPKLLKMEVEKIAVVSPYQFLPKVSTEQWVEDLDIHPDLDITHVTSQSAALAWLYYDIVADGEAHK